MSEVQHTQAEDHRGFQDTISPHIKRALGSLVAGAIIALPQAVTTGLSQAEVQDNLGPIPAIATLSPSSSSLHLGPGGTYFNQRITRNGVGVRVDVRGLPDQLENIADTPPAKLAKPYVAFYQHPETAIKGYSQALQKSFSEKFASSEMQTGGILALAGFAILTAGSTLSGNKRKKLTAATFGGLTLISGLTAYQTLESWQAENQTPSKQFAIGNTNGTVFEGTYADNSLLASVTNRAVPYIRTEAERQQAVNDRFIATSRRSINRELAKGSFAPPSDDQTMVLFISDLHSNFNLIDTYTYLTEQINEMYGDNTLQLSVFFGDQTFGSAAEKGAVDAMANISAETVAINGNHDGKITNEQEKAAGMKVLKGATIKTSQAGWGSFGDT
ncbi:MAG: hypothetical protein QG629_434 [Patescibacteria group bacterium]|nr:hypothetical protein [Patescibacteria group bacterium]